MEETQQTEQTKISKSKEFRAWLTVGVGALIVFNTYTISPAAALLSTVAGIVIYHGVLQTKLAEKYL